MKPLLPHLVWALVALAGMTGAFLAGTTMHERVEVAPLSEVDRARVLEPERASHVDAASIEPPVRAALDPPAPSDPAERAFAQAVLMRADPMEIPNSADAPLEVLSSSVRSYYGTKEVSVRVRSTMRLAIDGIRFTAFCYDQFNDPVRNRHSPLRSDTHSMAATYQQTLPPRATRNLASWRLHGQETCTKAIVVVRQVHFVDGTEWNGYVVQREDPRRPG